MKKILLIDANLLLFRSFYAAQIISKTPGNLATHLFFNTFFELYKEEKPEYVFFAFDAYGETRRHKEYPEYKSKRIKAPMELYEQKDIIKEIIDAMGLKQFSQIGEEADDLIATLSNQYKKDNEILILSEDKDLLQLVDKNISIIIKNRDKKLNAKYKKIHINNFYDNYNFYPNQVIDYKGIAGDTSDNLNGIKGIGPKTTIELLNKYQTLENIYKNIDSLSEKQRNLFLNNKENAFMCKRLATLNQNVNLDFDLSHLIFNQNKITSNDAIEVLKKYNLKKIVDIIFNI